MKWIMDIALSADREALATIEARNRLEHPLALVCAANEPGSVTRESPIAAPYRVWIYMEGYG